MMSAPIGDALVAYHTPNHPPVSPFLSWKGEEDSGGHPQSPAKGAIAPLDSPRHSTERYADFGY